MLHHALLGPKTSPAPLTHVVVVVVAAGEVVVYYSWVDPEQRGLEIQNFSQDLPKGLLRKTSAKESKCEPSITGFLAAWKQGSAGICGYFLGCIMQLYLEFA